MFAYYLSGLRARTHLRSVHVLRRFAMNRGEGACMVLSPADSQPDTSTLLVPKKVTIFPMCSATAYLLKSLRRLDSFQLRFL